MVACVQIHTVCGFAHRHPALFVMVVTLHSDETREPPVMRSSRQLHPDLCVMKPAAILLPMPLKALMLLVYPHTEH